MKCVTWIIGAEPLLGSRLAFCKKEKVFRRGNRKPNPGTYCCFSFPSMAPFGLARGSQEGLERTLTNPCSRAATVTPVLLSDTASGEAARGWGLCAGAVREFCRAFAVGRGWPRAGGKELKSLVPISRLGLDDEFKPNQS